MRDKDQILQTVVREGADILVSPGMLEEREFMQHGSTTVFAHSVNVTMRALGFARRLGLKIDERALVRGALLHDYFGYDWHDRSAHPGQHATKHAGRALARARKHFDVGETESDVIGAHMFPLNGSPKTVEGWLTTLADKHCALAETVNRKSRCLYVDNPDTVIDLAKEALNESGS